MLALYIIFGVLAFILLLLLLPLKFSLLYENDQFIVKAGLVFSFYKIYPKKQKPQKEKTSRTEEKQGEKKQNPITAMIQEDGLLAALSKISDIIRIVLQKLKRLLAHANINQLDADIKIATDDAANTAIAYGAACSIIYPVVAAIGNVIRMKKDAARNIRIYPDFDSAASTFNFHIKLSVQTIYVIAFLLLSGMTYYNKIINTDNNVKDGASS